MESITCKICRTTLSKPEGFLAGSAYGFYQIDGTPESGYWCSPCRTESHSALLDFLSTNDSSATPDNENA